MKYLVLLMVIILISNEYYLITASIPVCITNCVQCKKMYGPYFQGKICGEACIESDGRLTPDCNNPGTLGTYLKRLY